MDVHGEGREVSPVVGEQFERGPGTGPVAGVGELVGAAEHHADRRAAGPGELDGRDRLGGDPALGPEGAADVIGDDVDPPRGQVPPLGGLLGDQADALGGQVQVEVAAGVPAGHARVRLQRGVNLHGGGERTGHQAGVGGPARGLDPLHARYGRASSPW